MHCAWPRDYHSLGLTCIQFHSPNVAPLTNPAKVTDQGLCNCNSDARGWHSSHQSGVISIIDQVIFQNFEVYRRNNDGPKTLPCGTPDTTLTSFLRLNEFNCYHKKLRSPIKFLPRPTVSEALNEIRL